MLVPEISRNMDRLGMQATIDLSRERRDSLDRLFSLRDLP